MENFHAGESNRCSGCCFSLSQWHSPVNGWTDSRATEGLMCVSDCVWHFFYECNCFNTDVFILQQPICPLPSHHTGFLRDRYLIMAFCLTVAAAIWREHVPWPVGFTAQSAGKWAVWARTDSQNGCLQTAGWWVRVKLKKNKNKTKVVIICGF